MNLESVPFLLFIPLMVFSLLSMWVSFLLKRFVKRQEPKIWQRFGWSAAPGFYSLGWTQRDTDQNLAFSRWLRCGGAAELSERYSPFRRLWWFHRLCVFLAFGFFLANVGWFAYVLYEQGGIRWGTPQRQGWTW